MVERIHTLKDKPKLKIEVTSRYSGELYEDLKDTGNIVKESIKLSEGFEPLAEFVIGIVGKVAYEVAIASVVYKIMKFIEKKPNSEIIVHRGTETLIEYPKNSIDQIEQNLREKGIIK